MTQKGWENARRILSIDHIDHISDISSENWSFQNFVSALQTSGLLALNNATEWFGKQQQFRF